MKSFKKFYEDANESLNKRLAALEKMESRRKISKQKISNLSKQFKKRTLSTALKIKQKHAELNKKNLKK